MLFMEQNPISMKKVLQKVTSNLAKNVPKKSTRRHETGGPEARNKERRKRQVLVSCNGPLIVTFYVQDREQRPTHVTIIKEWEHHVPFSMLLLGKAQAQQTFMYEDG